MKIWRSKNWHSKEHQIAGFFDQGTNLTGELQFAGTIRIDGNFHGSINGGDTLIIGSNAVVHADIRVGEIEVHGQVFGNIEATSRAEIHNSGGFRGDLRTPVLVIHPGGILDGQSHMIAPTETSGAPVRESTKVAPQEFDDRRRTLDRGIGSG